MKTNKQEIDWKPIDEYVIPKIKMLTRHDVSKKFNISVRSIYTHYKKLGILELFEVKRTMYDWSTIDDYIEKNKGKITIKSVSKKFDIPFQTILTHYERKGMLDLFKKNPYKINWDLIENEVMKNPKDWTIKKIARNFNINITTVYDHFRKSNRTKNFSKENYVYRDWSSIDEWVLQNINNTTLKDISIKFDINYSTVFSHYRRKGINKLLK